MALFEQLLAETCSAVQNISNARDVQDAWKIFKERSKMFFQPQFNEQAFYTPSRMLQMREMLSKCLKVASNKKFLQAVLHPDRYAENQKLYFQTIFALLSNHLGGADTAADFGTAYAAEMKQQREEFEARLEAQIWARHVRDKDTYYQNVMFPILVHRVNDIVAHVVDVPSAIEAFYAVNALTSEHSDMLRIMWYSWLVLLQDELLCIRSAALSDIVYNTSAVPRANQEFITALYETNRAKQRLRPLPWSRTTSSSAFSVSEREKLYPRSIGDMSDRAYKSGNAVRDQCFKDLYEHIEHMPWSPERDKIVIETLDRIRESDADWAWLWNAINVLLVPSTENFKAQQEWDELGGRRRRQLARRARTRRSLSRKP